MTFNTNLPELLLQLEMQLKQHQLWQTQKPSSQALASTQPFAIDTLEPHQWLQWVFIHKLQIMQQQGAKLPQGFEIAPYFEQVWQQQSQYADLLITLAQIDQESRRC